MDGGENEQQLISLTQQLISAGVDMIQLRDKKLEDASLLERARLIRNLTAGSSTLFFVNDRPDIARLSRADGVHLGQSDMCLHDARQIVGAEGLIGKSTHSLEQALQAVGDGANYIGVGPVFPSTTKNFTTFPGLALLRSVALKIRLPVFAIGGIDQNNLPQVLGTGCSRVAVSGAVLHSDDPDRMTKAFTVATPILNDRVVNHWTGPAFVRTVFWTTLEISDTLQGWKVSTTATLATAAHDEGERQHVRCDHGKLSQHQR